MVQKTLYGHQDKLYTNNQGCSIIGQAEHLWLLIALNASSLLCTKILKTDLEFKNVNDYTLSYFVNK